jgi:DNA-binding sugar fermentation-stimulating protein
MNNIDKHYQALLQDILDNGVENPIEQVQVQYQYLDVRFDIKCLMDFHY